MPADVLRFVGEQVGQAPDAGIEEWLRYDWSGRTVKYHRAQIRRFFSHQVGYLPFDVGRPVKRY